MFERYLTEALTTHFGHLIENLDSEKVRLSAWRGEVVLEDLLLRRNALDALMGPCPVEITWGKIGNLELRIAWKLLRSRVLDPASMKCSIVLSNVNIVVTPRQEKQQHDEETEEEIHDETIEEKRVRKEKQVQQLLDATLFQRIAGSTKDEPRRWVRWAHALVTNLLSTLSVTVRDIHVRYEDPGACLGFSWKGTDPAVEQRHRPPFAVGITLRQFSVQTTNRGAAHEDEKSTAETETDNVGPKPIRYKMRHKLVAAYQLSVYWDSGCSLVSSNVRSLPSDGTLGGSQNGSAEDEASYYTLAFAVLNDTGGYSFVHRKLYSKNHMYLLNPVSPALQVSLVDTNSLAEEDGTTAATEPSKTPMESGEEPVNDSLPASPHGPQDTLPPSRVVLTSPPCHFAVSRSTLKDIVYIRKSMSVWKRKQKALLHASTLRRLARLRPSVAPKIDPRSWWRYALEATVILCRGDENSGESGKDKRRRKRGWRGFILAVRQRREYLRYYNTVLTESCKENEREEAHQSLLQMEDDLLPSEIVAFRLSVHSTFERTTSCEGSDDDEQYDSDQAAQDIRINMPLSCKHRCLMFHEMEAALDRETGSKADEEKTLLASSSYKQGPRPGPENAPILWKASFICPDFAVNVNDRLQETLRQSPRSTGQQPSLDKPIVRLSFASMHKLNIFEDASWEFEASIASLLIKDLTTSSDGRRLFSNLLGPKSNGLDSCSQVTGEDGIVYIGGVPLRHSASVVVKRSVSSDGQNQLESVVGTTTRTQVRLSPLEVVYATEPMEALARVFSTVKTPELADDYYRMASMVLDWRTRQKRRLLKALAQRSKKIFVDINIAAPIILIPEDLNRRDCPLLIVDLGLVRFINSPNSALDSSRYDDDWQLKLSNMHVLCSSVSSYQKSQARATSAEYRSVADRETSVIPHQLVEPFSLEFEISTKIANPAVGDASDQTLVRASATLPRLVFNLTSSAVRLVLRLQQQWIQRQAQTLSPSHSKDTGLASQRRDGVSTTDPNASAHEPPIVKRSAEFFFSAPLVAFNMSNDVDGRDCRPAGGVTPLVDLALRGIHGAFVQEQSSNSETTATFSANLRSVHAVDLYQRGGSDFSLLLSSLSPDMIDTPVPQHDSLSSKSSFEPQDFNDPIRSKKANTDLVSVCYRSRRSAVFGHADIDGDQNADTVEINFHELYVEWNPETLAAVQKAFRARKQENSSVEIHAAGNIEPRADSGEEFFDALENDVDDDSFYDCGIHLISEISSSRSTSVSDITEFSVSQTSLDLRPINPLSPLWNPQQRPVHDQIHVGSAVEQSIEDNYSHAEDHSQNRTNEDFNLVGAASNAIEVTFSLSKLRIHFNKDALQRRLLTAEMDGTFVRYRTTLSGGSRTVVRIGNLTLSDPDSVSGNTLYRDILGFKTDPFPSSGKSKASLLEMEIEIHPRVRRYVSPRAGVIDPKPFREDVVGVAINVENGQVEGFDYFVSMRLSPMRYVYLQQLWLEVVDYFFQGILGPKVWGKQAPSLTTQETTSGNTDRPLDSYSKLPVKFPSADASGFNITRFHVVMDTPVLLVPVSYLSPQHIRLEIEKVEFSNQYKGVVEGCNMNGSSQERMQWYNSCVVELGGLRIVSWCGTELSRGTACSELQTKGRDTRQRTGDTIAARIKVTWPVGPSATVVMPKWKVDCCIDSMNIVLRRADYALFTHVVAYNIGEPQRHVEDLDALQNVFSEVDPHENFVVRFGYDKKGTAPTTFDIGITIPSVCCFLSDDTSVSGNGKKYILEARCTDINWRLRKLSDRISRQRIACEVNLLHPASNLSMLRPSQLDEQPDNVMLKQADSDMVPELTYTSTTKPSGDNVRTLEIAGACIYFVYPAWMGVKRFFQNLPGPNILTQHEAMLSVQIGDRWYQIGSSPDDQFRRPVPEVSNETKDSRMSQHLPCYQFRLLLKSPRIVLDTASSGGEIASIVLGMSHLDYLHLNNGDRGRIHRSFFVHDLEVYTSSQTKRRHGADNSLIHPWCVGGSFERCNGGNVGNCDSHATTIFSDVLRARAAYSDMSIAIDVILRSVCDFRSANSSSSPNTNGGPANLDGEDDKESTAASINRVKGIAVAELCRTPSKVSLDARCDGFELIVVDDSCRHFANARELVILSLGQMKFTRDEHNSIASCSKREIDCPSCSKRDIDCSDMLLNSVLSSATNLSFPISLTNVKLSSLDLFDCLQPQGSKFRLLATSRSSDLENNPVFPDASPPMSQDKEFADTSPCNSCPPDDDSSDHTMKWKDFSMETSSWGFAVSQSMVEKISHTRQGMLHEACGGLEENELGDSQKELIEAQIVCGSSNHYDSNVRSLTLQWNPSTVIALQRFLGRLKKEMRTKMKKLGHDVSSSTKHTVPPPVEEDIRSKSLSFNAILCVESFSVCLNKEHQNRRLLQATLSGNQLVLDYNDNFTNLEASVEDFNAWDTDDYGGRGFAGIFNGNRKVVSAVRGIPNRTSDNENVTASKPFLKVLYKTFSKVDARPKVDGMLPEWVLSQLAKAETTPTNIDDYLSVSMATIQLTFIRERSEEILDYLSNGLPGKGMGYTSRAAKGFIKKRIKTRSFLDLSIDAPRIRIPRHENDTSGVLVRLGDVQIRSWFEQGTGDSPENTKEVQGDKEWWRILALSLQGIGYNTFEKYSECDQSPATADRPVGLNLILRNPTCHGRTIVMRGKLSFVDMTLKYSEYVLVKAVISENIGRDIDMSLWDNVEKAYWMEEAFLDASAVSYDFDDRGMSLETQSDISRTGRVAYASDARLIRYGNKAGNLHGYRRENESSSASDEKPGLDFKFDLDGFSLTLHRDDAMEKSGALALHAPEVMDSFNYDVVLFRVQVAVMSVSTNSAGDKSFDLSLYRIGLVDLGDFGRLARERYIKNVSDFDEPMGDGKVVERHRNPCAFCILAEGCSPTQKLQSSGQQPEEVDPDLRLTVEKTTESSIGDNSNEENASSKVTAVRIVINHLSLNPLIRPIRDIVSFVTCSWSGDGKGLVQQCDKSSEKRKRLSEMSSTRLHAVERPAPGEPSTSGIQVNLVAHYPTVFFVADESDPHSRALVLRGLAVVNASLMKRLSSTSIEEASTRHGNAFGTQEVSVSLVRSLETNLHSLETYINPDVNAALGLKPHHVGFLKDNVKFDFSDDTEKETSTSEGARLLGVALMQPVTAGIEYFEVRRDRFPTHRTLCVNVESVSTMISFEDLTLIEVVLKRWSAGTPRSEKPDDMENALDTSRIAHRRLDKTGLTYDVKTYPARHGLTFSSADGGAVMVDSIEDLNASSNVAVGDVLLSIDGEDVSMKSLLDISQRLQNAMEPALLTLRRSSTELPRPGAATPAEISEFPSIRLQIDVDSSESSSVPSSCPDEGRERRNWYSLEFHRGKPNGLVTEKSTCGNVPVVTEVAPSFFDAVVRLPVQKTATLQRPTFDIPELPSDERAKHGLSLPIPRTGAVITSVQGAISADVGYDNVVSLLECLTREQPSTSSVDLPDSKVRDGNEDTTYTITFLELESWGNVDQLDVAIKDLSLTFIDDFCGRDMPLFRGDLANIELHIEKGLGINTNIIDAVAPQFLAAPLPTTVATTSNQVQSFSLPPNSAENILKFYAIARTQFDYYHPRVAAWEPLLEACQLCLSTEWQAGVGTLPGRLAIEFSDRILHEELAGMRSTSAGAAPESICINVTDAASEVVIRTLAEWKEWRERGAVAIGDSSNVQDLGKDFVLQGSSQGTGDVPRGVHRINAPIQNKSLLGTVGPLSTLTESAADPILDARHIRQAASPPETRGSTLRHAEARKAAEAALDFAQKRGAETQKKGDSAKPFVFRNRTGMPLAFLQEKRRSSSRKGLERNGGLDFIELEDGRDAHFHIDVTEQMSSSIFSKDSVTDSVTNVTKARVRTYDGQLHSLTVVLEPVPGVKLDPICNLPVFKVGSSVRRLRIHREDDKIALFLKSCRRQSRRPSEDHYSVPVVWTVEIESNRRILTLSSAVSIMSLGLNTAIEVGFRRLPALPADDVEACSSGDSENHHYETGSKATIHSIGYARPARPFYIPLGLAMNFEKIEVFVRPEHKECGAIASHSPLENLYAWGSKNVLEFAPIIVWESVTGSIEEDVPCSQDQVSRVKLVWRETFSAACTVHCRPVDGIKHTSIPSAFLSCYASTQTSATSDIDTTESRKQKSGKPVVNDIARNSQKILTIGVDSGLSLRNMLPLNLEWEISQIDSQGSTSLIVDGSSLREQKLKEHGFVPLPYQTSSSASDKKCVLSSGDCAEVFACDVALMNVHARFRCSSHQSWSQWASVDLSITNPYSIPSRNNAANIAGTEFVDKPEADCHTAMYESHLARQQNVQIKDDSGVPLTIGVRFVPKLSKSSYDESSPTICFGVDVIAHADLWLTNLTGLPLAFGCPSEQIHMRHEGELGDGDEMKDENAAKVSAEAALMEIASVLELGDRGKLLFNPGEEVARARGDLHLLPYQRDVVCEEVFEYLEIESSTVKRRWWASENHDNIRQKPADFAETGGDWNWIDGSWMIDCTGQAKASEGGWESCRNLVGGKENTFSMKRTFNPHHPFRRRRWFRRRVSCLRDKTLPDGPRPCRDCELLGGINAFHQPVVDAFSRSQIELERVSSSKRDRKTRDGHDMSFGSKGFLKIAIKCDDGRWSLPAVVPDSGRAHGVVRVISSRWPTLTKISRDSHKENTPQNCDCPPQGLKKPRSEYKAGTLSPEVYELCYQISDLGGDWDEFSRLMLVTPRYMLRNDSRSFTMEVKQAGAPNETACVLGPGEVAPFYWADLRLPELVCVRPLVKRSDDLRFYRWSGGIDICNLGMTAIRIRRSRLPHASSSDLNLHKLGEASFRLKSVRSLVEIRPGTGSTGINVSFKEENWNGEGSLFRIENISPFPIWVAQDGVLANPASAVDQLRAAQSATGISASKSEEMKISSSGSGAGDDFYSLDDHAEVDGDLVYPMSQTPFALDVPFRQGKYAGRRAASMAELLRVRAALAPLSSREGIESTKVIGFTNVGECFRLNPTKLTATLSGEVMSILSNVRVLGVITTDGPTRVLRFCLMQTNISGTVFGNAFAESTANRKAPYGASSGLNNYSRQGTVDAASAVVALVESGGILSEDKAKSKAFFGAGFGDVDAGYLSSTSPTDLQETLKNDMIFSFRASFGAFLFSLVDSTPLEIATISMRNINALAKWTSLRADDASALISVGWLQVDNHVPSAPFPVAICPDEENRQIDENRAGGLGESSAEGVAASLPLLLIGLTFAPKHKTGILCMRSATISPRNLVIAIDLASIVRLLSFIDGIKKHVSEAQLDTATNEVLSVPSALDSECKKRFPFPDIYLKCQELEGSGAVGAESQKLYFEGLSILPCRVSLSVAPSRALTTAQASLEGREAAAIHAAVRKGDLLIDEGSVLGVHVGGKNKTALAVVRGVLKSIVVDALLHCDGASMTLSGVFLRNYISSAPQLKTYLAAHYLSSLRNNVPALLGSLAAFGNPLGLIRGLGDGVSDFVNEPVKGLKKSVQELDPSFVVDGVARGTESLARHAVGGFADSASLLTETFSKNMAVLTLDRRYAQRRDRAMALGDDFSTSTFVGGVESGVAKLVRGVLEGVTGVVRAPMRGAERHGVEGFAKGIGKGLLGLLVKPMIGISDAATDVMLGVKSSVVVSSGSQTYQQLRPRRPMYGRDNVLRPYHLADAAASALMMRTRLAGEKYLSHCDLEDKVALLSVKRMVLLGEEGRELLVVKFKHIRKVKVRESNVDLDGGSEYRVIIMLKSSRETGNKVEVISCKEKAQAVELCTQLRRGKNLYASDSS